ncbi:MAG: VOC family protein [Myxococcales bacterium]|nr:VOC family protein [Myxococcales bacterium]
MQKVRGIGGVFFKAVDPKALSTWYRDVLGLHVEPWGGVCFRWDALNGVDGAATVWSPFSQDTDYFAPSQKPYMFNFVVDDLDAMLAQARAAGAVVDEKILDEENGRFGWLMDPEGNRIELWQPRRG